VPAALELGGTIIVTSDHGNAEDMWDADSEMPRTAHTTNPVPFIVISDQLPVTSYRLKSGGLSDIAPTILQLLNIEKPAEMTGESLINNE